jgi:hypothetical protein
MIDFRLCLGVSETQRSVDVVLSGNLISVYDVVWDAYGVAQRSRSPTAQGQWDFITQALAIADPNLKSHVIEEINKRLGAHLRALDVPRQAGLFPEGCSVCGTTENTFSEGQSEPVRWTCHVCGRLVCRTCMLVWPFSREFYFHTYCCEACRAAAPVGFSRDDEDMR